MYQTMPQKVMVSKALWSNRNPFNSITISPTKIHQRSCTQLLAITDWWVQKYLLEWLNKYTHYYFEASICLRVTHGSAAQETMQFGFGEINTPDCSCALMLHKNDHRNNIWKSSSYVAKGIHMLNGVGGGVGCGLPNRCWDVGKVRGQSSAPSQVTIHSVLPWLKTSKHPEPSFLSLSLSTPTYTNLCAPVPWILRRLS